MDVWMCMDVYRCALMCMDMYGCADVCGCVWVYRCVQMCMDVRMCVDVYGCVQMCIDVWMCMGVCSIRIISHILKILLSQAIQAVTRHLGVKGFGVLGQESPVKVFCCCKADAGHALDSPCLANRKQNAVYLLRTPQNLIKCN